MDVEQWNLVFDYHGMCKRSFEKEKFEKILSPNIRLTHQVGDGDPAEAEGQEAVIEMLQTHIFRYSSKNLIIKGSLLPHWGKFVLKLDITEKIISADGLIRRSFEEISTFTFECRGDGVQRISTIATLVKLVSEDVLIS